MARTEKEPTHQQIFKHYLRIPVTDDYKWDEDPDKRASFILHGAAVALNGFLSRAGQEVNSIPGSFSTTLQRGGDAVRVGYLITVADVVVPEYRERIKVLAQEVDNILEEKGFRFGSSLLTPREHKQVGSSGYGGVYLRADPDVPVPVLRARLFASGQIEPEKGPYGNTIYSVEEADRGRRLMGKTRLDLSTGRTTDRVDEEAANNSYFFLSPERAEEIKKSEQEILSGLQPIIEATTARHLASIAIIADLARYTEGKLTTPEIEARLSELVGESRFTETGKGFRIDAFPYWELKKIAIEIGKWDHILTPQEILLRVNSQVSERYLNHPYTPLDIQDGSSVEEVASLRQGERSITVNNDLLGYLRPYTFSLEKLDHTGTTVRSPAFVDEADERIVLDDGMRAAFADRITTFPFARPEDWFYKKTETQVDEENPLECARREIQIAPERLAKELSRTSNDWLACFGSSVFSIETNLNLAKRQGLITNEVYAAAKDKLEGLKVQIAQLKDEHEGEAWTPPSELQQELFKKLIVL